MQGRGSTIVSSGLCPLKARIPTSTWCNPARPYAAHALFGITEAPQRRPAMPPRPWFMARPTQVLPSHTLRLETWGEATASDGHSLHCDVSAAGSAPYAQPPQASPAMTASAVCAAC